jgi:hypothetical protein
VGTPIVATREKQETRTKRESSKIQRREMGQKTETHQALATTGAFISLLMPNRSKQLGN